VDRGGDAGVIGLADDASIPMGVAMAGVAAVARRNDLDGLASNGGSYAVVCFGRSIGLLAGFGGCGAKALPAMAASAGGAAYGCVAGGAYGEIDAVVPYPDVT
jgi:hypothetical protein